jgi:hypothetical protein
LRSRAPGKDGGSAGGLLAAKGAKPPTDRFTPSESSAFYLLRNEAGDDVSFLPAYADFLVVDQLA